MTAPAPMTTTAPTRLHTVSMLLTLADSRLPTGGHVHSGGIEEAVTAKIVRDISTLEMFLRRRIVFTGAVAGSVAAAVCAGDVDVCDADIETDARTPSPAARNASRAQGRGLLRLATSTWPEHDWATLGARPHLAVVAGVVASVAGLTPTEAAVVQIYTAMTGSAIAAQRLLALDPAQVAACTIRLSQLCDKTAGEVAAALPKLAEQSDPFLDVLAQGHVLRERPLFAS